MKRSMKQLRYSIVGITFALIFCGLPVRAQEGIVADSINQQTNEVDV